jgi:hypothetical protein
MSKNGTSTEEHNGLHPVQSRYRELRRLVDDFYTWKRENSCVSSISVSGLQVKALDRKCSAREKFRSQDLVIQEAQEKNDVNLTFRRQLLIIQPFPVSVNKVELHNPRPLTGCNTLKMYIAE